jgi:tRNA(Ile)-lysidine synthase
MFGRADRVLAAVSGGPDSIALLSVLFELSEGWGIEVEAAHYNHRLRGAEADRDQACAQTVARQLGVPFHVGMSAQARPRKNVEEGARAERYAFLFELAKRLGCTRIATGHTLDDQAETVVMRLLRGSGPGGLTGIVPVRSDGVIRPLIECDRAMVLAYLRDRNLPSCEDSMNADPRFLRSRVRHEVMPLLRSINPLAPRALARTANAAAADDAVLDRLVGDLLAQFVAESGALVLSDLKAVPAELQARVVRSWLAERRGSLRSIGFVHIEGILRLVHRAAPGVSLPLPGQGCVQREYDRLWFRPDADREFREFTRMITAGDRFGVDCGWRVAADLVASPGEVPGSERTLWYFWGDAQFMGREPKLRTVRRGDRIEPLGLSGHRKLQDVFVDRKVPRARRWHLPVLEIDGHLLWVPGVVRSGHALISPETRTAWRLAVDTSAVAGA